MSRKAVELTGRPNLGSVGVGGTLNRGGEEGTEDEVDGHGSVEAGAIISAEVELLKSSHDAEDSSRSKATDYYRNDRLEASLAMSVLWKLTKKPDTGDAVKEENVETASNNGAYSPDNTEGHLQSHAKSKATHEDGDKVGNGSDASTLSHDPEKDRAVSSLQEVTRGKDVPETAGQILLSLNLGLDLSCLSMGEHTVGVGLGLVQLDQDGEGFIISALLHEPTGRLGKEVERDEVDNSHAGQDDEDETPLDSRVNVAEGKVEDGAENVSSDDADTLHTDERSTSMRRSHFTHVHRRVGKDHAGTDTTDDAEDEEHGNVDRRSLKGAR
jgi:hypothetical protein